MFHVFELDDFGDWCWVTTFPREDAAQMLVNIVHFLGANFGQAKNAAAPK